MQNRSVEGNHAVTHKCATQDCMAEQQKAWHGSLCNVFILRLSLCRQQGPCFQTGFLASKNAINLFICEGLGHCTGSIHAVPFVVFALPVL